MANKRKKAPLKTSGEIIERFGGPTEMARVYFGDSSKRAMVAMWIKRGIPARHRYGIVKYLERLGIAVDEAFLREPTEKQRVTALGEDDMTFAPGLDGA